MMLLIAAVAQRWCSGGLLRETTTTDEGISMTRLITAGMTDLMISPNSRSPGVRAIAAGATPWPAGPGAGTAVVGAGARYCAVTSRPAATTITARPTTASATTMAIEILDMGLSPLLPLPVECEGEHLTKEDLTPAHVHEELHLVGAE